VPAAAGLDAEKIKDVDEDEFGAKVPTFLAAGVRIQKISNMNLK
jgi:hypothetical protein